MKISIRRFVRSLFHGNKFKFKRILFDAAILQQGMGAGSRSGIFTVTTELLRQFANRKDVEIDFYASDGSVEIVKQYQRTVPWLADIQWLDIEKDDAFDPRSLKERYDGCFSPVFAFPEWLRRSGLPRYIVLYDTIPLLFPDLYPHPAGKIWVEEVIESLTPDDFCFAISESAKEDFLKFAPQIQASKLDVMPLAASDRFYVCRNSERIEDVRRKYGIPIDRPYFLSLSSLEPRKNLVFTINAFAEFAKGNRDVVLVLAGKAWSEYESVISEAVRGAGDIAKRIVLTGYIDDEDLAPLYSGATAFVFLSLYEGFGLPPLEAMQCGTPVLTSDTSSLPEVVGDAGLMVSPNDLAGVVSTMMRLYSDKVLRKKLSSCGLARSKMFSWTRAADIILSRIPGRPRPNPTSADVRPEIFPLLDRMAISRPAMRSPDGSIMVSNGDILFGPYLDLSAGSYRLVINVGMAGCQGLDITAEAGKCLIKRSALRNGPMHVDFELQQDVRQVEFVVRNEEDSPVAVRSVALVRRGRQRSSLKQMVRRAIKSAVPYGLMCSWLQERYGIKVDETLFHYRGKSKCMKRLIKFSLPFGFVMACRHCTLDDMIALGAVVCEGEKVVPPSLPEVPVEEPFVGEYIFHVDSTVASQDELNSRMIQEVEKRRIGNAN